MDNKISVNKFEQRLQLYQNANSSNSSIKENFVIRLTEYNSIIGTLLKRKEGDSLQHELILGRRGSGKSTLLKRIEIEIAENPKLNSTYFPINLGEEQSAIYRLFDLWLEVINELYSKEKTPIILEEYNSFKDDESYSRYLFSIILDYCNQNHKTIVLILDNFDVILDSFHSDANLLRETLINYQNIQIIGGSTKMTEHFWKYDQPFYDFFRIHRLEALSFDEINLLINHWSGLMDLSELKDYAKHHPGKIENIRILTDGLPRTLQFFIEILLQKTDLQGYEYLKSTMDKVSPLFQERLKTIPPQLRKIVIEMAFLWEACNTKQLVAACKMDSKLISANLKTLSKYGIVDIIDTKKRNHLYRLSERFFNMWLIATQGNPNQKRKAKYLSIFLENWYDAKDFKQLVAQHLENLKSKSLSIDKALLLTKAYSQSRFVSTIERDTLINRTKSLPNYNHQYDDELPESCIEIYKKIDALIGKEKYDDAFQIAENIENESDGIKFSVLGFIYEIQQKFDLAEIYYLKAIDYGENNALIYLASLYTEKQKFDLAEKYFLKAIENGDNKALFGLALLYNKQQKFDLAENHYLKAIENGENDAFFGLALLYNKQQKFDLAENYYLKAIDYGENNAIYGLALLYNKQQKFDLAEKYFLKAIEYGDNEALFGLALLYENLEKFDLAEIYYLKAIENGDNDAFFDLALLYENLEKFDLAEKHYLKAIESGHNGALKNLALLYYTLNINKLKALELISQYYINSKNEKLLNEVIFKIWNGKFENIEREIQEILNTNIDNQDFALEIQELLIHQQKNLLYSIFQENKLLQEKYQVMYYVIQLLVNPTDENLKLLIPPELNETITAILNYIKEKSKFYGYS